MKNILAIMILATISFTACSQNFEKPDEQQAGQKLSSVAVAYRLYPTKNMWTFIKLDTRNGKMWQVQYNVQDNNRFEVFLSLESLVGAGEKEVNDRFVLCPTENMYNFLLLDQLDGRVWQVQWSLKAENRVVIPIS